MDQLNAALQSWGVMVAYLPWIIGFVILLLIFITASLSSISSSLKDIADELLKIRTQGERSGASKTE
jgi:hypothetical protein